MHHAKLSYNAVYLTFSRALQMISLTLKAGNSGFKTELSPGAVIQVNISIQVNVSKIARHSGPR